MAALPNRRRKRTGKAPHYNNTHLKETMISMRKKITAIMNTAMVTGRAMTTSTSNQAMAEELVNAGRIHRRIKATLRNKDIMITAGQEVLEIQDHRGVAVEEEAQIMGDHQQRIVVEVEEVTLMVMVCR